MVCNVRGKITASKKGTVIIIFMSLLLFLYCFSDNISDDTKTLRRQLGWHA